MICSFASLSLPPPIIPPSLAVLLRPLTHFPFSSSDFGAGSYTSQSSISQFFDWAVAAGFVWEEFVVPEEWEGETEVKGLVEEEERLREGWREGLSVRKRGGRVRGFRMWWARN